MTVLLQRFLETAFVAQSLAPFAQSDNLSERIMFLDIKFTKQRY